MTKLLFIYNARSGLLHLLVDALRKIFSPQTYPCNLCRITYGIVAEHRRWRQFRLDHADQFRFLHADEFESEFPVADFTYPIVLQQNERGLSVIVSTEELNQCKSQDQLIEVIESRRQSDSEVKAG